MLKKGLVIGMGMSTGPIILLFATPWLARAYSPEEFGTLAIFMAVMSVISSISCLRHDAAILVVQDSKVYPTVQLAFIYTLSCSILAGVVFSFLAPEILGANYNSFRENQFQLVLGAVGGGAVLLACALSMRREEYLINAVIRMVQGPTYVLLTLLFATSLVEGWAYGWALAGLLSVTYLFINIHLSSLVLIWKQAVNLREYSLRLTPTFFFDSLALNLPILFISMCYTSAEVGNYSQVSRLIGGPLLLVSAVIGQLLLEKTGKYYRNGNSSMFIFKNSVYILLAISIFVLIIIFFAGHYLVDLILGAGWRDDTFFLLVISIPILCKTIISPLTCVFLTHEQTKYLVNWQTLYFLVTLLSLSIVAFLKLPIEILLIVYALSEIALYVLCYYWAQKVVKNIGS
jgi:O-antigen/teichoic acid export membrane protein